MTTMKTAAPKLSATSAVAQRPIPPIQTILGKTEARLDTEMVLLPDPVGYHMLVALPTMAEKTASGIYIPEPVNDRERAATVVGVVVAMGDECYKDPKRFPAGKPWCKVGDTVLFARYSGMRFRSMDAASGELVEYRMLSDDNIVGVVPDGAEVSGL